MYGLVVLMLVFTLAACSPGSKSSSEIDKKDQTIEGKTDSSDTVAVAQTEEEKNSTGVPKYLPADFPLPKDSEITNVHTDVNEGKKYILFNLKTKQDVDTVAKLYTDYFEQRKLEDFAQTIDKKNIIIQGDSPTHSEYWSIIGGASSVNEGYVELLISWEEL